MEINAPNLFAPRHLDQCFHVTLMAVHPTIAQKTHQVEPAALIPGLSQRIQKIPVLIESPLINVFVNESKILVDDAAGAEDHVADFGVAHLAFRQTDIHSRHGKTGYRKLPAQSIDVRNRSLSNSIALFSWIDSPSVQDHQDHRLLCAQVAFLSFGDRRAKASAARRKPK